LGAGLPWHGVAMALKKNYSIKIIHVVGIVHQAILEKYAGSRQVQSTKHFFVAVLFAVALAAAGAIRSE
jgi:hypothetical protein